MHVSDLVAKVRELAGAHPTAIYQSTDANGACYYTRGLVRDHIDGEEKTIGVGCLMGQALKALDVPEETLYEYEDSQICEVVEGLLLDVSEHSNAEIAWLADVQQKQDAGNSWGNAVQLADKRFAEVFS